MGRVMRTRRTTWLGSSAKGTTLRGWIVIVLAILLLIAIVLVEDLVF
jgi:hypothetical protein